MRLYLVSIGEVSLWTRNRYKSIIYAKQRGHNVTGYCCILNTTLHKHEHQATSFPAAFAHAKGHE